MRSAWRLLACIALALPAGAASAQSPTYRESPILTELVKAGKIPTVDKRVPRDALVVKPAERVGTYGGTWRLAYRPAAAWSLWAYVLKENEIRYADDLRTPVPSLVKGIQASPDNKVFTFALRQGLRWSDGEPCDADDYVFWWEDIVGNADLTPIKPPELMAGGKLGKLEKVDQYTIRFTFEAPYATFLHRLAQPRYSSSSTGPLARPVHYLKQFHTRYAAKDALDKSAKDAGYASWVELFNAKANNLTNPALPVLCAWRNLDPASGAVMRLERNPYYWKVDPASNQLPYIDRLEVRFYDDADTFLAKALAGECDFQSREVAGLESYAALSAGADAGGYRVVPAETLNANIYATFLNRLSTDPVKSQLLGDLRFRQALSLAIDRDRINTELLGGAALPTQASPPPSAASYDKSVARVFAVLDTVQANALLDELKMPWDAAKEYRLGPDGKPLVFTRIYAAGWPAYQARAQELVREDWRKIGINVRNRLVNRAVWSATMRATDWDMAAGALDVGGGPYLLSGGALFPQGADWPVQPAWGLWYESGQKSGAEPPAEVKQLRTLLEEYVSTATPKRMLEIEREATRVFAGNVLAIGVVSRSRTEVFYVVSKRMKNVSQRLVDDATYAVPAQFYLQ